MSDKNFINYHVLISHSPSCLNRDDMNMQKDVIFGGVRRVRYSSQSLKRAIRKSEYYKTHLGEPSDRTNKLSILLEKYTSALAERYPADSVRQAVELLSGVQIAEKTRAGALAPWAVEEVAECCRLIQDAGPDADENALKKMFKEKEKNLQNALNHAVDIALSGRMTTSGLLSSVDGALALAHVITTHEVKSDIDWFTAVDDLVEDSEDLGAGHLNTQEFSSGVFYRYASLNICQLQENLGHASRGQVLEIAGHLLHMMATIVPTAKQQPFAAYNLADMVMVSVSDQPISLANAFEQPVQAKNGSGYVPPSMDGLFQYWQDTHKGYGIDERTACFSLRECRESNDMLLLDDLPALQNWLQNDARH